MKVFILFGVGLLSSPAFALLGSGDTNISQSYPCVGMDGVPIPAGAMETACCSGGRLKPNPPATCRAGFNTISGDAAGGAAFNLTLAETTLNVASGLNGANTNINEVTAPNSGPSGPAAPTAVSSGITNAGIGGEDGTGDSGIGGIGANGFGQGAGGSGSGSGGYGGGAGASGSGGVGMLSGSTNGSDASKQLDPNAETNKAAGGKYASNSGQDGFGSHSMEFGSGNGVGVDGKSLEEMGFGDEDLAADSNGEVEGTVVDPSNYFSLTHKSDDIFKIVTRRYHKKWNKLAGSPSKGRIPAGKLQNNKPL